MKKHPIFSILILFSLFISSCKYDLVLPEVVPPVVKDVSFATDIVPIFAAKCISCHSAQAPQLKADVAYSQIVPKYVNTATPESSVIYINASSGKHYATVSATQAAIILKWITDGAKNN